MAFELQIYLCFWVFFFPSHPHSVSVLVLSFMLCSLLLGFIRYWFFSFDFDFDYLILWSFSRFFFFFLCFISDSPFMLVVEYLVHMMILISIFFMTNESCVIKWTLKLSSCLFETLKLICYLDVMNLSAMCYLDVNVMTSEFIYLVLLKVYYVKVGWLFWNVIMLNSLKRCYTLVFFLRKHIYYYWIFSFSILKNY